MYKKVKKTLENSEKRFFSIFNNMDVGITVLDLKGHIIVTNKRFCGFLGYSKEEISGRHFSKFTHPEDLNNDTELFDALIKGKKSGYDIQKRHVRKDGKIVWGRLRASLVKDENGHPKYAFITCVDITKRKLTEKALRESQKKLKAQYKAQYKGTPIPTYTWQRIGEDFVLVDYNDAAAVITHGNVANFVGKKASGMYKDRPDILEELSRCFAEKTFIKREMSYLFSTGEIKHLAVSYGFVPPDMVLVHTEDITERKKAEGALRESERRYRNLVETAPVVIFTLSKDGTITSLNPAFEKITGWSRAERLGKSFTPIIHPDDLPLAMESFQKTLRGETPPPHELRVLSKSGEYLVGEFTSTPQIENGKVVGEFGIARDITKHKKAEEALRESEERYRELTESITDVFFGMGRDLRYTYWNKASEKLTGISAKDAIGKSLTEVFPDVKGTRVEQFYLETLRAQQPQSFVNEYRVREKDYIFEINAYPTKDGLSVFVKDITERKKAEEELIRLSSAAKMSTDSIVISDLDGKIIDVNEATLKMYGTNDKRDLTEKSSFDLITPEEREKALSGTKEVLEKGYVKGREYHIVTKDGGRIPVEMNVAIMKDADGKPIGFVAISRDITERKRTEEALRESQEKFKRLFMDNPEAAVYVDSDFCVLDANPRFSELFGYSLGEIKGKRLLDIIVPEDKKEEGEMLDREAKKAYTYRESVRRRKDGTLVPVSISAAPIIVEGKSRGYVGLYRDITERKMLEERLSALNLYGGKLNAAHNLQQVYELTLDAMEQTLGFEHAAFMVVEKGTLRDACLRGYPVTLVLELPLDGTKKGITVKAANTRRPVLVPDVEKDKDYVGGIPSVRSELAVPVITEDKVFGVLDVESRKLGAFDEKDVTLLQILASHAATAISNLKKRGILEKRSNQFASLMKSSAEMIHSTNLRKRLEKIAEAIRELGWRRAVITVRDENMAIRKPEDMVTAGLTDEEREFLWNNRRSGQAILERYGPEYERFKIGEFYHLPWSDPWVREKFSKGTVPSHLEPKDMVDWDPQDLLYAPLRLAEGRIVGTLSIDDPLDGRRPTKESLAPLELFIHQGAVAIENARLFQQLKDAKNQIKEYADQLELKVKQRTQELMKAQKRLLKTERLAAIGEIAAMVGHDLRNPLTGIAGATYYLKMKKIR